MVDSLRTEEVSIDHEKREVGNVKGLSLLEEFRRQDERFNSFIDEIVLLRAACMDDWSQQKEEQDSTRTLRNNLAHSGNLTSDIETIKRYLWDVKCVQKWKDVFFKKLWYPV